jgi:hypothetical protein
VCFRPSNYSLNSLRVNNGLAASAIVAGHDRLSST